MQSARHGVNERTPPESGGVPQASGPKETAFKLACEVSAARWIKSTLTSNLSNVPPARCRVPTSLLRSHKRPRCSMKMSSIDDSQNFANMPLRSVRSIGKRDPLGRSARPCLVRSSLEGPRFRDADEGIDCGRRTSCLPLPDSPRYPLVDNLCLVARSPQQASRWNTANTDHGCGSRK